MASKSESAGTKPLIPTFNVNDESMSAGQPQTLNPQAFSDLSRKIQAQFSKLSRDTPKQQQKRPQVPTNARGETRLSKKVPDSTSLKNQARGKKRDSQGKVKEQVGKRRPEKVPNLAPTAKGGLEEELYALGGTAEDLALVADLDSESELDIEVGHDKGEGDTKFENGLKKGIADLLKQIDEQGHPSPLGSDVDDNDGVGVESDEEPEGSAPFSPEKANPKSRLGKSNLLVSPRPDWFNTELPNIKTIGVTKPKILLDTVRQLYEHAKSLLDTENETFKAGQKASSSQKFYTTVIASGTLSDKISALTLAVQESPLHNTRALETLINLGKKRSRTQAVDVLRALKDLFAQGSLLPSDRKLHSFSTHPNLLGALAAGKGWRPGEELPGTLQRQQLIVWAYESWLKEKYFDMLKTLEVWCNDEIEFSKSKAINFAYELFKEKPEQESNLLRLLTNKLGDPSKKIASQTSYLLMQVMVTHPRMKMIVIASIESDLLFRPGQSLHAKYYATITLNQTALSSKEEEIASKLLDIYFSLFVGILKPVEDEGRISNNKSLTQTPSKTPSKTQAASKKPPADSDQTQADELREKLTSAILTGINRAYPYTGSAADGLPTHLETLFKITHSSNFNTSIQAMMLIQQLCSSHQVSTDRFYKTLYESLLDARLPTSSKHSLYLNLLYRALKADTKVRRIMAFAKRILQILTLHQPSFICGCFFLLQELRQTFPGLAALLDQPEEYDAGEEAYEDVLDPEDEPPVTKHQQPKEGRNHAYDGRKRDPEYSNAENSCLWEVLPFLAHFHPAVSVSGEHIMRNAKLPGKPDLELHTLIHFLDRFVYRNAKIGTSNLRGSSIMQPMAGSEATDILVSSISYDQMPVNSESFWNRKSEDVAAEDAFFHQYFNTLEKTVADKRSSKKTKKGANENESDDEESEVWKAMMESAPDLEGAKDSDEDLEMSDLESAFEESLEDTADEEAGTDGESLAFPDDEHPPELDIKLANGSAASGSGDEQWMEIDSKKLGQEPTRARRRRLKKLPTFASASDYAKLIDDDEGEEPG